MNVNLIRTICESRHRWIVVAGLTLLLGLGFLWPQVDLFYAQSNEQAELEDQLANANRIAQELPQLEQKVSARLTELASLDDRTVQAEKVANLRNELMNAVRDAGCQLRRLNLGDLSSRQWMDQDLPLEASGLGNKTPFLLEKLVVNVSVTGSLAEVQKLISDLEAEGKLIHAKMMELHPDNRARTKFSLELELWYFGLNRAKSA